MLGNGEDGFGRESGGNISVNTMTLATTRLEKEEVVAGGTGGTLPSMQQH